MGLDLKGVIRPGMDADLTVIRPEVVVDRATYARPRQFPTGIPHVIVNGEFVVRDGDRTGVLPGRAIRA
jgi:N-acyl-D-amino-acid deacylase